MYAWHGQWRVMSRYASERVVFLLFCTDSNFLCVYIIYIYMCVYVCVEVCTCMQSKSWCCNIAFSYNIILSTLELISVIYKHEGHPSKRPYFFKALSSFNDPRARPLTSLFQNLKREQKALIFIGDSLMMQYVKFFLCQASRENLEVVPDHADRNCFWRFNISIHQTLPDSEKSWVPVHFMRIGSLDTQSMCPSNKVGKYHLGNRSYTLGNWKSVKEITRHLIEVCEQHQSLHVKSTNKSTIPLLL